jgi:thiol-disulfide isomerase/thioredoxin
MVSRRAMTLALFAAAGGIPAHAMAPGAPLPAIVVHGLSEASSPVDLAALRGHVVYVDFWASWCVPCRESLPQIDALYRAYRARGLRVVGVNEDVSTEAALRFLARVPVSFPLVSDADDGVARAFDVRAMPSGYVVDREGVVRYVHRGFTPETLAELRGEIESLLGDRR